MMEWNASKKMWKWCLLGFFWFGVCQYTVAQCPTLIKYEVSHELTDDSNRGTIRFFLQNEVESANRSEINDHEYNLWDKKAGVYLYNPSKLDAGFYEDKKISFSLSTGVAEFNNVPEGKSYLLVVYSSNCRKLLGPSGGISIQNSAR